MKRFFSFLLALSMVLPLLFVPAGAANVADNTTAATENCPCGCGQNLDSVTWTPWDVNGIEGPSSGHYYLDGNYIQDGQKQIMAGDHVVLDLRGCTLTTKSYSRLLLVYGQMFVLDTVGGGRFMSKTSGGAFGGVVTVSTNEVNDSVFEFLSGTITRDADNKGSRRGGLIHVSETATFRMRGGMLLNGSTVSTSNPDILEPGGCIAGNSRNCTIEILGGQIVGGESATYGGNIYCVGTTVLKNCRIIGGVAAKSGGNIYQSGGTLTVENCIISDGVSNDTASGGGNIAVSNQAVMTLTDTTVRNGYANYHGGNIYLGTGSAIILNSQILAGVARNRGNNLYGSTSATGLTLDNCDLPGDISYLGSNLVLTGKVKIGLLNHGLRLYYGGDYAAPLDATGLTEGSEIYVVAKHTFTTPGADQSYFKGAIRTLISQTQEGLSATYASSGQVGGYCPHCNQVVAWEAFSTTDSLVQNCLLDSTDDTDPACTGRHLESGHYYLSAPLTGLAQPYVGIASDLANVKDVVIDMAGYNITATHRAFYIRSDKNLDVQSSLTILDSYGSSKITGSGADNQPGGVIYSESSKLTIYDGNYIYAPVSGRNVTGGGIILNGDSFTMHGGVLDAGNFTYTDASTEEKTYTYYGGAVYQYDGTKYDFTMTAGRINGGTAQSGGAMYFGYNNQVQITGGQFVGGVAQTAGGGCIRMAGGNSYTSARFHMSGASIRDGRLAISGAGGGNLNLSSGTTTISDTYIEGGYSEGYGGNIATGLAANITFTNCIVEGGYSAAQSGNVHLSSTSTTTNWTNCQVLNGSATYGGNFTSGNGYNTFRGGQILFGTARTSYGGNIAAISGNAAADSPNYTRFATNDQGNAPALAGGSAKTYGGNLYVGGVADLQAIELINGQAQTLGQDLYVTKGSKQSLLTLGSGVTGTFRVAFKADLLHGEIYGQAIDRTVCPQLNATMILEGNYNDAVLCTKDGVLHVGAIAVIDGQGNYTWFTDTAAAVAACDENSYVKLFIAQDVVLTKDCAVDICGHTVQFTGAYTLYGMDSSGDGFKAPTGKAILAQETQVAQDVTVGGKRYITTTDATGTAFHRLENRITGISLRPSQDGIYFTGSFGCDETLAATVESYGIAVSTANMPGLDFAGDEDTLYTVADAASLVGGATVSSVLIRGILEADRSAALNNAYGKMPIFATAYLQLQDGTVILSDDTSTQEDDLYCSLQGLMSTVDTLISEDPLNYRIFTNPTRDFYSKWEKKGMEAWDFQNIIPPEEDDVLNILMIGSSGCYYYVEELYGLLNAAGIKANVCNVYYSGCTMYQHYTWWQKKEAHYEYFQTNGDGRVKTANVSLEWCLQQQNWDVISLQESGTAELRSTPVAESLQKREVYLTTLYDYLKDQFPAADFYWHENAAYQVGYNRTFTISSLEEQTKDTAIFREFAIAVSEKYNVGWIPRGDAAQIVREGGYDQLCARLGKGDNNEGDYYHDGDIGGGQYLTACVWFETITGQSVIGSAYVPTYTYNNQTYGLNDGITVEILQNAAHQAVAQIHNAQ